MGLQSAREMVQNDVKVAVYLVEDGVVELGGAKDGAIVVVHPPDLIPDMRIPVGAGAGAGADAGAGAERVRVRVSGVYALDACPNVHT